MLLQSSSSQNTYLFKQLSNQKTKTETAITYVLIYRKAFELYLSHIENEISNIHESQQSSYLELFLKKVFLKYRQNS